MTKTTNKQVVEAINKLPYFLYEGKKIIVDTGAPRSLSRTKTIKINADTYQVPAFDKAIELCMPNNVIAILGMDIINKYDLIIEPNSKTVNFFKDLQPKLENELDYTLDNGIPHVDIIYNGEVKSMLFDTGAHINYIHSNVIKHLNETGEAFDFNPYYGTFETNLYNLEVKLNKVTKNIEVGVLPTSFQQALGQRLKEYNGILGLNIFENKKVIISPKRRKIFFE